MLAVCVIALLSLVSVTHSAPLGCEDLIRPLDHPPHLEGKWSVVAASLNDTAHEEEFKRRNSTSANFVNETSTISFTLMTGIGDSCKYVNENITLEGSSFTFHHFNVNVTLLHTSCQDCVVMYSDNESKTNTRLYIFSKRRELEPKEMDDFMLQVGCLHMPAPILMDGNKELCPEQTPKVPAPHIIAELGQEADS